MEDLRLMGLLDGGVRACAVCDLTLDIFVDDTSVEFIAESESK